MFADDDLLINQVSSFPQLYVKSHPGFKNTLVKEMAWKNIAAIIEETPEACERRWKVLRNKYTTLKREHRHTRSGTKTSEITWPYFQLMKFLDPYLLTRKSYLKLSVKDKNKPDATEWDSTSNNILRHTIPVKKENTDTLAEKIVQKVHGSNTSHQSTAENDDEYFVKSLVQDLKVFSQTQKIVIKREIYNVLVKHLESIDDSD